MHKHGFRTFSNDDTYMYRNTNSKRPSWRLDLIETLSDPHDTKYFVSFWGSCTVSLKRVGHFDDGQPKLCRAYYCRLCTNDTRTRLLIGLMHFKSSHSEICTSAVSCSDEI